MHSKVKQLIASKDFMQQYKADMGKLVGKKSFKIIASHYETMVAMMTAYDSHTGSHLCNAEDLASHVAMEMKLPTSDVMSVTIGALMHDVGKIGVHYDIITKPGALTAEERKEAERHVDIGKSILTTLKSPWPLAEYAYMHHERMDGTGYPQQLSGDQIPLNVRILSACDVTEALMAHRPYRTPWTFSRVLDHLNKNASQFDADVIKAIESYKSGS
jgi:HD-GYP domain-containing protein (c-di-GMP phosphodiesterase class II)